MPAGAPKPARSVAIAAFALIAIATLAVLELGARVLFPLPALANFNRIEYAPTTITPAMRGKHYLMNATLAWESAPDRAGSTIHLNLYGFRDPQWDVVHKRARRIAFVGDSFVEGFMAADDESIPAVFRKRAQERGAAVEVFNLGIGGTDLMDYVKLIQDAVPALEPDELVLVFYANDFFGAPSFSQSDIRPAFVPRYRSPIEPRIVEIVRRAIAGETVPTRWHSKPSPFLAAVPDPSNPFTKDGGKLDAQVDRDIAQAMREGRFNPFVVGELTSYGREFKKGVDISPHLEFLRSFLASHHVSLRLAFIPYPAQVADYYIPFAQRFGGRDVQSMSGPEYQVQAAAIAQIAARLGIPFLDLTEQIRAHETSGEHLYYEYDHHMRPVGYAYAAGWIYDWMMGAPR
jgi:hypothetical protein